MLRKVIFLILACVIAVSCNEKKSEAPSGLIGSISQQFVDEDATVTKNLESIGLDFQPGYKTYGSKKLSIACEEKQLSILKNSEAKILEIDSSLTADFERFRDKALDFYRKIQDAKTSLNGVNTLLQPYCEHEHKFVKACFNNADPVLIHINYQVATFMKVHPVLVPDSTKEIGIYLLKKDEEDEDYIRSFNTKDGSDKKHYNSVLPEIATVEQLDSLFQCLTRVDIKTEIGQKIKSTARISFQLGRRECLILKGRIDEAARKSKAENINFEVPISAQFRNFCGDLLK